MKILFLAHRTPYPPNKGEKIRAYHFLSNLAKSHAVTLVYWVDDPQDLKHTPLLRSLCRGRVIPVRLNRTLAMLRAVRSLLNGRSFTEGFYGSRLFQHAIDDALRHGPFDAVYVFSSAVAPYAANIEAKAKIVDFVDVDSDKWGQLAEASAFPLSALYRIEKRRLACLEIAISKWASRSLFVSMAEAQLFRKIGGQGCIEFLSNGTDLELRRLPLEQIPFHAAGSVGTSQRNGAKLIFVGTMDYYPNIDAVRYFAEEIFPLIRQKYSEVTFEIVGRRPSKVVRRLSRIDGIEVVGEVADVRSYLVRADVSVAPMRIARGVQNKVLEAMALGVPVVATPAAIEGIEVCNGEEVFIATSAEQFAQRVLQLLSNADLRKTMTKKAWNKMNQFYNWDLVGSNLEKLLKNEPVQNDIPAKDDVSVGIR
jgi:sugar transferase (PEP-CTERM/EpsH1 system associated)